MILLFISFAIAAALLWRRYRQFAWIAASAALLSLFSVPVEGWLWLALAIVLIFASVAQVKRSLAAAQILAIVVAFATVLGFMPGLFGQVRDIDFDLGFRMPVEMELRWRGFSDPPQIGPLPVETPETTIDE